MNQQKENSAGDALQRIVRLLERNEPLLADTHEIPDNVMQKIRELETKPSTLGWFSRPTNMYLTIAQRFLTAASVCLLILYGVEEFSVLKKMNTLEQQTSSVQIHPASTIARRLANSRNMATSLQRNFLLNKKLLIPHKYLSVARENEPLNTMQP